MAVRKVTSRKSPESSRPKRASKTKSKVEALDVKESSSSRSLLDRFKISKRNSYIALGVVGLGLLLFLGSRYLVIAWVDNKPVTRFEYYNSMDKKYGNETRENLIVEKLFYSEAAKRRINVTDQEINDELKKIEERAEGAEALDQALQANGMTRDDLKQRIRLELLKQKMFGEGVNVSDEDLTKYMDENKEGLAADLAQATDSASMDKLKEGIRTQLKQQKVDQDFNAWLTEALQSSRIVRN